MITALSHDAVACLVEREKPLVHGQRWDEKRTSGSAEGGRPVPGRGVCPHPLFFPAAGALVTRRLTEH